MIWVSGNIATNRQPGVLAALAPPGIATVRAATVVTAAAAAMIGSRLMACFIACPAKKKKKFPEAR
jgi:hypothetical protein